MHLIHNDFGIRKDLRAFQSLPAEIADSDMTDQLLVDQPVQCTHRFRKRYRRLDLMDQIEIEIIRFQPFQGTFQRTQNIIVMEMCFPDFGSQEKLLSRKSFDRSADNLLGIASRIHLRSIDQSISKRKPFPKSAFRFGTVIFDITLFASAHLPGSETERRHSETAFQFLFRDFHINSYDLRNNPRTAFSIPPMTRMAGVL